MALARKVNITTTSSIDGWDIEAYIGPVIVHRVAGTGIISDFFAGFSDVFGGRSGSYRDQLTSLSDEVLVALQHEASALKANWVVGLTMDMDEVAGKGMQMFMVTGMGTAVRARYVRSTEDNAPRSPLAAGQVSAEQVEIARQRACLLEKLESETLEFTDEVWTTLIDLRLAETLPAIVRTLAHLEKTGHGKLQWFRERAIAFVDRLDPMEASAALHPLVGEKEWTSRAAIELISHAKLRDLRTLRCMLETSEPAHRRRQLQLFAAGQRVYSAEDIEHLRAIAEVCDEAHFPRVATTLPAKTGFIFKYEMLRCECGEERAVEERYCPKPECRRDVYGFRNGEVAFDSVRDEARALASTLEDVLGVGRPPAVNQ
jgi:uncharacterized protein YbjQ (UPF0145 family)